MLKNQITSLTNFLRDEDLQQYTGDAFWSVIKVVTFADKGALVDVSLDIKNILFHIPTMLFWDKMKRYMFGTFKNFREQTKLASKFDCDNNGYQKFVKKQIHLINEINDDKKIDYFAQLTRSFLLTDMEEALFHKLSKFLTLCTPEELDFIASFGYEGKTELSAIVSSLYQYGLFEHRVKNGGVDYVLSGFAKALKINCLNYYDESSGRERAISYKEIPPLNITEPTTWVQF